MLHVEELSDTMVSAFMSQAYQAATGSSDSSNQNGAVLVDPNTLTPIGVGANNFAPGVDFTLQRATERPAKYRYYEHAERWAVYDAARQGKPTAGTHMVCPWAACCDCARSLIVAGVSVLYLHQGRMLMTPDRWKDDVNEALNMLMEAGVLVRYFDGQVAGCDPIHVNGIFWNPFDTPITDDFGNWAIGMEG
jgi:dCMP deaminase